VLYTEAGKAERAVSEATAFLMASMLSDVINHGTAYRARQAGFTLPAAGKTGTTNEYIDAWFVGFTPRVVTGVWIGFDKPRTIIANGYAGELAVPMWASFMKAATQGHKADWYDRPRDVVSVNVCRVSGKLPNAGCGSVAVASEEGFLSTRSMVYAEYFRKGSQPTGVCPLHPQPAYVDVLAGASVPVPAPVVTGDAAPDVRREVPAATTGTAPPPEPAVVQAPPPATPDATPAQAEPAPKRRGFWSRLFGRGGDKKNDKKDDKKKPDGQ
jgi:membrane peptidoglycan carboxypeptidase